MKLISLLASLTLCMLLNFTALAQWTKINTIPSRDIIDLSAENDLIIAATDTNLIYISNDSGENWTSKTVGNIALNITAVFVFNQIIYVGTYAQGIFISKDMGITWASGGASLLSVIDFTVYDNKIYAATAGTGVAVLQGENDWQPFNNGIPSYSQSVNSIISLKNSLMIDAGANGTFYTYDFLSNQWKEGYYYDRLFPGLQMSDMLMEADVIFAVSGNRILYSQDEGLNWREYQKRNGIDRIITVGREHLYIVTNTIAGDIYFQYRSKKEPDNTALNSEDLLKGYAYRVLEQNHTLYLAKNDGLYVKKIITAYPEETSVYLPKKPNIYPNPVTSGEMVHIQTSQPFVAITIYNESGQVVYQMQTDDKQANSFYANFAVGIYQVVLQNRRGEPDHTLLVVQ